MEGKKTFRTRIVGLRLSSGEYDQIEKKCGNSTAGNLSEYVRRVLFNKPIVLRHRNQSLDDFMAEMIRLRTELNAIGNNYNQAVKRLHTLQEISEFQAWIRAYETQGQILSQKVEEIKDHINKIADEWLR